MKQEKLENSIFYIFSIKRTPIILLLWEYFISLFERNEDFPQFSFIHFFPPKFIGQKPQSIVLRTWSVCN